MERSQISKFWGSGGGGVRSPRDRSCLSPAPSEGRAYLKPPGSGGRAWPTRQALKGASPRYGGCGKRLHGLGPGRLPGQPGICCRAVPLAVQQGRSGGPRGTRTCVGRTPNPRGQARRKD